MDRRRIERAVVAVIVLAFAFGTVTHALDFLRFGWAPYRFGPPLLNLFWNALVALDAIIVGLFVARMRRSALVAALTVMVADVAANSYAWRWLDLPEFATSVPIQSAFLCLLVGAAPFLWPKAPAAA